MIVFVSNYYNHHQAPVAEELYRLTNGQYRFIATSQMPNWRKKLGYQELTADFVININESKQAYKECVELINNADVVIIGSAPEQLLKNRKRNKKLILRYSERPLKNGIELKKYPFRLVKWNLKNPPFFPTYMLCASAYTAKDYAKFGLFRNKCYKWGYFPECKHYENAEKMISKKQENSILWVGRLIDWKHPEIPILVADKLKKSGYKFSLNIIGTGDMEESLKRMIDYYNLNDCVKLLGAMRPEEVREYMEKSQIYMFTSNQEEGWGAVLNEAMNSGCAVVANSQIGSVPFLMKDKENGLVYSGNNVDEVYERVKYLLDNRNICEAYGKKACLTIKDEWSPEIAVNRLLKLCEEIKNNGKCDLFNNGPCSRT